MENTYLFSVDLEDVRFRMKDGDRYKPRVPDNAYRFLDWLRAHRFKCTFFAAGDVAEAYPSLIGEIYGEGHEIACHTSHHIPLTEQSQDEFKRDLEANVLALTRGGATNIRGFRAPEFSLTEATAWAYGVLRELGFTYSSSVLPAKNPFYCWPEFGPLPRKVEGVWEIPMTVAKFGPLTVPPAGGVYFRVLPKFLVMRTAKRYLNSGRPLLGYCHPYDIDTEQEHFLHPDINDSRFYNFLIFYNRKNVFRRLEAVIRRGFTIRTFAEYADSLRSVPGNSP